MDTDTYIENIAKDIIWICQNEDLTITAWQEHILSDVERIVRRIVNDRLKPYDKRSGSLKV